MDFQVVGWASMDWIDLPQGRDRWRTAVNAVMKLRFPENGGNFLASLGTVSFSRRTLLRGIIYLFISLFRT
jgi:hypothetical protein